MLKEGRIVRLSENSFAVGLHGRRPLEREVCGGGAAGQSRAVIDLRKSCGWGRAEEEKGRKSNRQPKFGREGESAEVLRGVQNKWVSMSLHRGHQIANRSILHRLIALSLATL